MTLTPSLLSFPDKFTDWTPGQWDTICQVVSHLAQPEPPVTILEAPTGVGKSAIALAVTRLLKPQRTVFLTGTKQLQKQYLDSFGAPHQFLSVLGRGNFPCLIDRTKTAADANCTVGLACQYKGKQRVHGCPYFDQRDDALTAPEVVTNYPYWLAQTNYAHKFQADLLICDEAHTLEEEVRKFASIAIRKSHVQLTLAEPDLPPCTTIADWKEWAAGVLVSLKSDYAEAQQAKMNVLSSEHRQYRAVITLYEACLQLCRDPDADDDHWVIESQSWGTQLRPVWVGAYVQKYVLTHAKRVLCMSATILSKDVFSWTLGLDAARTEFIQVPSRFPKENRPINYRPVGKVKGGPALQAILPTLVGAMDDILDQHPNERGLIHTVSYEIAREVAKRSKHRRRLVTHDSTNRTESLDYLRYSPGAVLISPSMTTGVDLPYDLCRFQIICKLAFPYLGDPQIKKRMKLGPDGQPSPLASKWYSWLTACTLIQTYGRGVRAIDDACVTYLLDGNWDWFRHSVRDMLPGWFTEAIVNQGPVSRADSPLDIDALLRQYANVKLPAPPTTPTATIV